MIDKALFNKFVFLPKFKNMKYNLICAFICCLFLTNSTFAQTYQAGKTYLGTQNYIEYRAGNLPIIITAPHGGRLEPTSIADRNCATCTTVMDANTMELASQIDSVLRQTFGCFPHIVINRLHRKKLDANREIVEAAGGSAEAEVAWQEWHQYIQAAKTDIVRRYGRGILIDIHGHGHTIQRLEIGYLLDDPDLRLSDSILSTPQYRNRLSVKNLVFNNLSGLNAAQLLRGAFSLGTLLASNGFPAVPSQQDVAPVAGDLYFNGGYNTLRHGSRDSTTIDAIQIECNNAGVRDNYANRQRFATELSKALKVYLGKHYFSSTNFSCSTATLELDDLGIQIFPNPTNNVLNIRFDKPLDRKITARLTGLNGQFVLEKQIMEQSQEFVLTYETPLPTLSGSSISKGMYILILKDENEQVLKRFKVFIE
jgi:N-formylglutamate amidohydrolase